MSKLLEDIIQSNLIILNSGIKQPKLNIIITCHFSMRNKKLDVFHVHEINIKLLVFRHWCRNILYNTEEKLFSLAKLVTIINSCGMRA